MMRHTGSGLVITTKDHSTLTSKEQESYESVWRWTEQTIKVVDAGGKIVEATIPVVTTLRTFAIPGATVAATILGLVFGLYKKWKAPLIKEQSLRELISNGSLLTADAIDDFKGAFPQEYKNLQTFLIGRRKEASKAHLAVITPDEIEILSG